MSNESTALVIVNEQPQDISANWSQDDLQALKATLAKGCDDSQFKVFIAACRRLQLDPFARQITPIVQGGGMTPQVTIDGFRLIAERTRKYLGQVGPFWCGPDGEWHDVWLDDKRPTACKVGVIREGFREVMWGTARTNAYYKNTGQWPTMPDVMIAKVAESLALRKAFPNELSGVYTREEMQQALADENDDDAPAPAARQIPQRTVAQAPTPVVSVPKVANGEVTKGATDLRLLSNQLGWTVDQYELEFRRLCGAKGPYSDSHREKMEAYLRAQLAKKAQAEAAVQKAHAPRRVIEETGEIVEDEPLTPETYEHPPFDLAHRDAPVGEIGA